MEIKRGELLLVNLDPVKGSEQGKTRPALVIQNDIGNKYSPTIIIASITSKTLGEEFPTDIIISSKVSGLENESKVLLNQIRTIDKSRIIKKLGFLNLSIMEEVDLAIKVSLGLK